MAAMDCQIEENAKKMVVSKQKEALTAAGDEKRHLEEENKL